MDQYSRTGFLLGKENMAKLKNAHVAVFGLGGVGGYAVEALARSGIGQLTLVDHDTVSLTNLNRQILATHETVGMEKALAAKKRVQSIDPAIKVNAVCGFFGPDTKDRFDFASFDFDKLSFEFPFAKTYERRVLERNFNHIMFKLSSGENADCAINEINALYTVTNYIKGVR